jgi:hypothetical protein
MLWEIRRKRLGSAEQLWGFRARKRVGSKRLGMGGAKAVMGRGRVGVTKLAGAGLLRRGCVVGAWLWLGVVSREGWAWLWWGVVCWRGGAGRG